MSWVAVAGIAISAGTAAYSANQQKKSAQQGVAAAQNMGKPPDYNDAFQRGFLDQYQATPWLAQQEFDLRQQYAPANARLAADIYDKNIGKYAKANMRVLNRIDPQSVNGRNALYDAVSSELSQGRNLGPDYLAQIQNDIRAGQTARGNYRGNAPIAAEAAITAREREGMWQQRVTNMMNFLRGPTPQDHFGKLAGAGAGVLGASAGAAAQPGYNYVEPARGWAQAYADNAARQFSHSQGRESNIAQAQAQPQQSPWGAAMMGALGAGSSYLGSVGTSSTSVVGAPSGGAVPGYSYSPQYGYRPV